jgi:hypothetical protein
MGTRPGQVQPTDRCAITGQLWQWPEEEHLVKAHLDMHYIAVQQTDPTFESSGLWINGQ